MRRSHRVSAERVTFGRGTNNEVPLVDIRIELSAAALSKVDDGLVVESLGQSPLRVNGSSVMTASVKPGDEVLIGPYRIALTEPPEGVDAALSIELVQPIGNSLSALVAGSRITVAAAAIGKRSMSWTALLVIVVACIVAPIAVYWAGLVPPWHERAPHPGPAGIVTLSWNAGQLSNPHRAFAVDCAACHQHAFIAVSDKACLTCHSQVGAHAEVHADLGPLHAKLATMRCTQCHQEHRGLKGLVIREAGLCVNCHRDLAGAAPGAGIKDVTGFPMGHPEFRATLVADPTGHRLVRHQLGTDPAPRDHPGLHFSHAAHLVPAGFPALGYKPMVCADCHKPEPGGLGFLPITYKGECQSCHALKFDSSVGLPWPDATVPHGDDSGIVAAVWNYYAGKALQTGITPPPAPPGVTRRAAGTPPPPAGTPPETVKAWVAKRTEEALRGVVLEPKRGCAYCHLGTGPNGKFELDKILPSPLAPAATTRVRIVAPVVMEARFLPKAQFDHAAHATSKCEDCHAARKSQSSSDVLIPGIQTCLRCHGGETAALRTQSTCITCHVFHHTDFGPMRMSTAKH
ncbi:MAG TPA: cytochrome c3 family protein [Stellaceae bacterium]|nr:cytochrome c3 family protein [Stellaceae bacterium]